MVVAWWEHQEDDDTSPTPHPRVVRGSSSSTIEEASTTPTHGVPTTTTTIMAPPQQSSSSSPASSSLTGKDVSRLACVLAALFLSLTNIFTQQVVTDSQHVALLAAGGKAQTAASTPNQQPQLQRRQQLQLPPQQLQQKKATTLSSSTQRQESQPQPLLRPSSNKASTAGWKNDLNVVHVIHTRFMQHQPQLVHLGQARLELFRAFCLPTLRAQTNQQFLWIIRVDPDLPRLNPNVTRQLLDLMRDVPNAIVAGSNARVDDGFFRHPNATIDLFDENAANTNNNASSIIWHGSVDLLRAYQVASQTRVLLETGLDADDGLAIHFVDHLQKEAYKASRALTPDHPKWFRIACMKPYTVWQFWGPYENSKLGSLRSHAQNPRKFCLTPGLTRMSSSHYTSYQLSPSTFNAPDRDFSGLPREGHRFFVDHFYIDKHVPHCRRAKKSRAKPQACYDEIDGSRSLVLRTRTPTSASLTDVHIPPTIRARIRDSKELAQWDRTLRLFGLNITEIQQARYNLNATMELVLEDAASGYCTIGHSCMSKTKDVLRDIRAAVMTASA